MVSVASGTARPSSATCTVNARSYALPTRPTVVICYDGCDPAYVAAARDAGVVPHLTWMMSEGFAATAQAVMNAARGVRLHRGLR